MVLAFCSRAAGGRPLAGGGEARPIIGRCSRYGRALIGRRKSKALAIIDNWRGGKHPSAMKLLTGNGEARWRFAHETH